MRRLALFTTALPALLFACGGYPDDWEYDDEWTGTDEAAIVNGSPDYNHDAVVFLALSGGYGCSGTFIEASGNYAWVLTAAHCVTPHAPVEVRQGFNIQSPDTWYSVDDYDYHPAYSGGQGSPYDVGVVRVWNTGGPPPIIPAATSPDGLSVGTQVRHVGYGITSYPNGYNDERRQTVNTIDQFITSSTEFMYDESVSGTCQGDSGGPALTMSNEKVAGIISRGEEGCQGYSIDGRTSQFYSGFIRPYIDGTPIQPLNCDQCFTAATTGNGACMGAINACFNNAECDALVQCFNGCSVSACYQGCIDQYPTGYQLYEAIFDCVCDSACTTECANDTMCTGGIGGGGGIGGTGGTGGSAGTGGTGAEGATGGAGAEGNAPPTEGDSWVAGDLGNEKYKGDKLSACATRPGSRPAGSPWVLWLAAAVGFTAWARRRER